MPLHGRQRQNPEGPVFIPGPSGWIPGPCVIAAAVILLVASLCLHVAPAGARDLEEVRATGVLRHIGITYANFVTAVPEIPDDGEEIERRIGDGLAVELVQRFAKFLDVRYEFVLSNWYRAIGDITDNNTRGDLIAGGMVLPSGRDPAVAFSDPIFPTQVWVVACVDFPVQPIRPSGDLTDDIRRLRNTLRGRSILCIENSGLDPALFDLEKNGANVRPLVGYPDELASALIDKKADMSLLYAPDALIAMEKWPGKIKVMGPISGKQEIAVAFRKDAPKLRKAFNDFFAQLKKEGAYDRLVRKYYPTVFDYFPEFFKKKN